MNIECSFWFCKKLLKLSSVCVFSFETIFPVSISDMWLIIYFDNLEVPDYNVVK